MISSNLNLNKKDFNRIRDIVFKNTGISLSDAKGPLIVSRLSKRLIRMGIPDFTTYVELLEEKDVEVLELINRITTNLTYFYREADQFKILQETILENILSAKKNKNILRIWSAACSTGAEVYTILFEMLEYFKGIVPSNMDLKILGSDIDTTVLNKAKSGAYTKEELNKLNPEKVNKYFNRIDEDLFVIKEELKKFVGFRKINLVYDEFKFKQKIDIIFCRNVAIYFDDETKDKLYKKFYNVISDEGYIFSGQSENLFKWNDKFKFIKKSIYKRI